MLVDHSYHSVDKSWQASYQHCVDGRLSNTNYTNPTTRRVSSPLMILITSDVITSLVRDHRKLLLILVGLRYICCRSVYNLTLAFYTRQPNLNTQGAQFINDKYCIMDQNSRERQSSCAAAFVCARAVDHSSKASTIKSSRTQW